MRFWRRVKSALAREPWSIEAGTDAVPIDELVSPLRYDILVRQAFFAFIDTHRAELDRDPARFEERARAEPYYAWYVRIHWPLSEPARLGDPAALRRGYAHRIALSVNLLDRFRTRGFDARHPILLNAGRDILPTTTGKLVRRAAYAGDGCHRIALLLHTGMRELAPGQYRVRRYANYSPRDNTGKLLDVIGMSGPGYLAFLARGYGHPAASGYRELSDALERTDPARRAELDAIMAADRMARQPHETRA